MNNTCEDDKLRRNHDQKQITENNKPRIAPKLRQPKLQFKTSSTRLGMNTLSPETEDEDKDRDEENEYLLEEEEESLTKDLPSWMDEESKKFNIQLLAAWRELRLNWREKKLVGEDPLLETCETMVLSPVEESVEGREKQRRREQQSQAEQRYSSWELMRTCKDYLEKNSSRWEKRTREETERIRAEEKRERLEMVKEKKKKFGSNNGELTKNEKDGLRKKEG